MHTTSKIVEQIVELSEIKSAYNHYLCTCNPKQDVENYTYIMSNKAVVSHNLKQLYTALAKRKEEKKRYIEQHTTRIKYKASKVEELAIFHFNKDRRFTITE